MQMVAWLPAIKLYKDTDTRQNSPSPFVEPFL